MTRDLKSEVLSLVYGSHGIYEDRVVELVAVDGVSSRQVRNAASRLVSLGWLHRYDAPGGDFLELTNDGARGFDGLKRLIRTGVRAND